jgi:hypothetical protein
VAACVIPEDAWHLIPEREIRGLQSISLCTMRGEAKYDVYREAWGLLRKASEIGDPESGAEQPPTAQSDATQRTGGLQRMAAAANDFKRHPERGSVVPKKAEERGDSVSVHPAVHIRTLVTRPSWTSPRELVPAEVFLLRYVSFQIAWRVRGAPGNLFLVFLWLPQGSLILHSFFTTVRGFCVAVRDDLAESGCIET